MLRVLNKPGFKVITSRLEDRNPIPIPSGEEIKHLHLSLHGGPRMVDVYNPEGGYVEKQDAKRFALYLKDRPKGNGEAMTLLYH